MGRLLAFCLALASATAAIASSDPLSADAVRLDAPLNPARTPRLKPTLQPNEVTLEAGTDRKAELLLTLPFDGSKPVKEASVRLLQPAGITAEVTEAPTLPSDRDMVWRIGVRGTDAAPLTAKLLVALTYATEGAPPNVDVVVATLTLSPPNGLASNVKGVMAPAEASLDQYNCLLLDVQLYNADRRTAVVDDFRILSPPYVRLAAVSTGRAAEGAHADRNCPAARKETSSAPVPTDRMELGPGSSGTVELTVATSPQVVPGTYNLVVAYALSGVGEGRNRELATLTGKVTVGVPGVSDVMSLLGVPSFLLLPGVLSVISFVLVLAAGRGEAQLDWKSPRYLFFAATLSFAYAVLYPLLVAHVGALSFDLVHGYNVLDAAVLWLGSIVLGGLTAVVWRFAWFVRQWRRAKKAAEEIRLSEPSEGDDALSVLAKLARHGADFRLRTLEPANGGAAGRLLLLPFGSSPKGSVWATSRAIASDDRFPLAAVEKDQVEAEMTLQPRPDLSLDVWKTLNLARTNGAVRLAWANGGPRLVEERRYRALDRSDPIVQFDWR